LCKKETVLFKKKMSSSFEFVFSAIHKKNGNTHVLELEGQGLIFTK